MPKRALALIAGIGLVLGAALPATARNVNAENTTYAATQRRV